MQKYIEEKLGMTAEDIKESEFPRLALEHDVDVRPFPRIETAKEIEERRKKAFQYYPLEGEELIHYKK